MPNDKVQMTNVKEGQEKVEVKVEVEEKGYRTNDK
jgi:hypothetical protein